MTTRTTFEDRLLAELQGEIERREIGRRQIGRWEIGRRASASMPAAGRRLFTGRRFALAAGLCAAAGLAVVMSPGTPAQSPAYAVERHDDGTVTLTVKDQDIGVEAQRDLARKLSRNDIGMEVQILRPGYVCQGDPVLWGVDERGERTPIFVRQWSRKITLHRGNVLVFLNLNDGAEPYRVYVYPTEADVKPCVQVKPKPNRSLRA